MNDKYKTIQLQGYVVDYDGDDRKVVLDYGIIFDPAHDDVDEQAIALADKVKQFLEGEAVRSAAQS